jgi:hypothetical protein
MKGTHSFETSVNYRNQQYACGNTAMLADYFFCLLSSLALRLRTWRWYLPAKYGWTSVKIHGVTIQKFVLNYSLTHGVQPFSRSRQLCSHSRISEHFMEPEGSIPRPQKPSTGPYPEPYQSNPLHPILSKIHFNIVHPPIRLGLPSGLFPSGFHTNILYEFLFSPIRTIQN